MDKIASFFRAGITFCRDRRDRCYRVRGDYPGRDDRLWYCASSSLGN